MNPLIQITKTGILERQVFSKIIFPDYSILQAIERYEQGGTIKQKAQEFIKSIAPLWHLYNKETYVPILNDFIEMELSLEAMSPSHTSHINHIIQEFLFGYNIIINCNYIKKEYDIKNGKSNSRSKFGKLFFSWMAASLIHDIGYDIENAPEEEEFREKRNKFWNFMTKRIVSSDPPTFKEGGNVQRLIEKYILSGIRDIPSAPNINYADFQELFTRKVEGKNDWKRYDHGIISAVKYLTELKKLQEKRNNLNYLDWSPNKHAILAMALHNFRYMDCDLSLSIKNNSTIIAYLLIICDEIQYWERERLDIDAEIPKNHSQGIQIRKKTELIGVSFKSDYAYVSIDHKLNNMKLKKEFEDYLYEKILLLKKHYPITVMFPKMDPENAGELNCAVISDDGIMRSVPLKPELSPDISITVPQRLIELDADSLEHEKDNIDEETYNSLKKIVELKTERKLLAPSNPPVYKIYIEHRIENNPYLTIVFPL